MPSRSMLTILALCVGASLPAVATRTTTGPSQSFESCGMIAGEYITVLQLLHRGITGDQLIASLPALSDASARRIASLEKAVNTDGLSDTFSAANAHYIQCSQKVYDRRGMPAAGSRESHFHDCASANKLRYESLMASLLEATPADVLNQLPETHHDLVRSVFNHQQNGGTLAAFEAMGNTLKACLNH